MHTFSSRPSTRLNDFPLKKLEGKIYGKEKEALTYAITVARHLDSGKHGAKFSGPKLIRRLLGSLTGVESYGAGY